MITLERTKAKEVTGQLYQEDDAWIASCDQLPIAGYGNSDQEAIRSLMECLLAFISCNKKLNAWESVKEKYIVEAATPKSYAWSVSIPL